MYLEMRVNNEKIKPEIGVLRGLNDDKDAPRPWRATGFVISKDGLVATAHHVIGEDRKLEFITSDGRNFLGDVVADDAELDLSILKLDVSSSDQFDPFVLDQTGTPAKGELCRAIGYPKISDTWLPVCSFGSFQKTEVTRGHEVHLSESIGMRPRHVFAMQGIGGHSGSPIMNSKGEVIAVVQVAYRFVDNWDMPGVAGSPSTDVLGLMRKIQ